MLWEYCGTKSELVEAVLECIECLTDDGTFMGGRLIYFIFSGFALLMMMTTVCLFNVCFDICLGA